MRKNADARVKTWKVQKLQATVAQQQDVFQSKLAEQQKQIVARRKELHVATGSRCCVVTFVTHRATATVSRLSLANHEVVLKFHE